MRASFAFFLLAPLSLALAAGCGDDAADAAASTDPSSTSAAGGSGGAGGGAGGGGGRVVGPPVATVVSTSDQSSSEHEPQLVVTSHGRVVVAWVDGGTNPTDFYHVAYRVSDDLGATWGAVTSIPLAADNNIASNTSLAANDAGDVWFAFGGELVSPAGERSNQRVLLAKLSAGASSFGEPAELTDPSEVVGVYDQPSVSVRPDGGLVVAYGQADATDASMWLVIQSSDDGGATWTKTTPLKDPAHATYQNLAHPCVAQTGGAMYIYYSDGGIGLTLWRSPDGGVTWEKTARAAVQDFTETGSVSTLLDGNCVARGDEVWVVYGLTDDATAGSHTSVPPIAHLRLAHSSDGGATIDRRTTIEDPAFGPHYLLPRIALDDRGEIDVTYYAGMADGDAAGSYRLARSTDGGVTFDPSAEVRSPITYALGRATPQWLGDYMGLVPGDGALFGAFSDNASGASHVVFFRQDLP